MDYYVVNGSQTIRLPRTATEPVVMELFGAYSPGVQWEIVRDRAESVLIIGEGAPIGREGYDFALNVTPIGVFIEGADDAALTRGLYAFLERLFCYDRGVYRAECGVLRQSPEVGMRVAHLCVFPETPLYFLEKCVRTAAFCRYSHVILEFWGMIRLDSFPQMAWPFAFSKAEISALVRRARSLGLEIIPMLQHLGHASMSRQGASGKHVVLDQAPELEYLYLPGFYGWVWDYTKPAVRHLLADIRDELCALCGEGRYFMIGCDEADDLGQGENSLEIARGLCEYLNDIQADLAAKGRRAIMWGDMLLCAADMPLARRADGTGAVGAARAGREGARALRAAVLCAGGEAQRHPAPDAGEAAQERHACRDEVDDVWQQGVCFSFGSCRAAGREARRWPRYRLESLPGTGRTPSPLHRGGQRASGWEARRANLGTVGCGRRTITSSASSFLRTLRSRRNGRTPRPRAPGRPSATWGGR